MIWIRAYSSTRYGGNDSRCRNAPDSAGFANIDVPGRVDSHGLRAIERSTCSGAIIPREASNAVACNGGDRTRDRDFADAAGIVGDVEVARTVICQPLRAAGKSRTDGGAVADLDAPAWPAARDRGNDSLRAYRSNPIVRKVGNLEIARCIEGHADRVVEQRKRR